MSSLARVTPGVFCAVDADPRRRHHDPEFDPPRSPGPGPPHLLPQDYQRLVGNPFLAVLGLILWSGALRLALHARNLRFTLLLFACLAGIAFLLQYHCLDCGATGWLFRWRVHACDQVLARRRTGRILRFRGPVPTIQALLWCYLLLVAAILAWIALPPSYWEL